MALAQMQAVGLSVSPGLTFLTKCQNHSESLSLSSQPLISHKMSESLGEEPKKNLAEQEKQKPSLLLHNFHNLNINKALKSTHQITVIIPSGTIFISRKRYRYRL
jgi:hypothetical protein